jgi:hypothetical protein
MLREIKVVNAILNSYKIDKNLTVVAFTDNNKLIYIVFLLDFKNLENIKMFRIALDNIFYILTDNSKIINEINLAQKIGAKIDELSILDYPFIAKTIGELSEIAKNFEKQIKNNLKIKKEGK